MTFFKKDNDSLRNMANAIRFLCADMVEKSRDYQGVEKLRELYYKGDLDSCFKECLKEEMIHLTNKKQYIYIRLSVA